MCLSVWMCQHPLLLMQFLIAHCISWFSWRLVPAEGVIHPLSVMLFGSGVYEMVLERSPVVWLSSFWSTVLPQDLLFEIQGSVLGSGMWHMVYFQISSCFHHCKHMMLAVAASILATCWLFWFSSSTGASMWCAFTTMFSTWIALSFHSAAAQIGLPLYCQLFCFHSCNHLHRVFATFHESV